MSSLVVNPKQPFLSSKLPEIDGRKSVEPYLRKSEAKLSLRRSSPGSLKKIHIEIGNGVSQIQINQQRSPKRVKTEAS